MDDLNKMMNKTGNMGENGNKRESKDNSNAEINTEAPSEQTKTEDIKPDL